MRTDQSVIVFPSVIDWVFLNCSHSSADTLLCIEYCGYPGMTGVPSHFSHIN